MVIFPEVLSTVLFSTLFSTSWVRLPMSLASVVMEAVVVMTGCPIPAIVNPLVVTSEAVAADALWFYFKYGNL